MTPRTVPARWSPPSNGTHLGQTKGFSRANGTDTDPHGIRKDRTVTPLRTDIRRRCAQPGDRPSDVRPSPDLTRSRPCAAGWAAVHDSRARSAERADIPDFHGTRTGAQGRAHRDVSTGTRASAPGPSLQSHRRGAL